MNRSLKIKIAAVMTALVASMGITTAAVADDGAPNAKLRSWCC